MSEIKSFDEYKENKTPHIVQEVMCVSCFHRWVCVRPQGSLLKELECPKCGKVGYVLATGQEIEGE